MPVITNTSRGSTTDVHEVSTIGRMGTLKVSTGEEEQVKITSPLRVSEFENSPFRASEFEISVDGEEIVEELESGMGEEKLTDISGVDQKEADILRQNGYDSIEDVRQESQRDLAEIFGIGDASAARIKADVGGETEGEEHSFLEEETLMVNMHE